MEKDPEELTNLYENPEYADLINDVKKQLVELQEYYEDDSDMSEKPEAWQKKMRPGE